ncbi:MAG: extracellular solute-binding protein [Eubacteriales bacterium]|nr:extracellular solute-binding protein [Eubacteriales bacterium]
MKKRSVAMGLAAIMALAAGAGSVQAADNGEKETVKIAVSTYNTDWAQPVIEAYEKENPNVDVELIEVSGNDMNTKLTMMMQSEKTAPDVIAEDGFMVKADAAAGYLEPLDDRLADWDDFKNFEPAILENGRGADGKQYGIPYSTDVQGIWYNKVLMEEAGMSMPFEPKNWDDIIDAGKKLKEVGGDGFVPIALFNSKSQGEATSMRTFQNLYYGTNSELYDYDEQKWVIDTENYLKVLNFIDTVYNKEDLGGPIGVVSANNLSDLMKSDYMLENKVGMFLSADGTIGEYKPAGKYAWPEALDVWGFAKIPTVDGSEPGYTTISGGWTWGIPAKASNKDGGFELLKFIANMENQRDFCVRYNVLTVRNDVAQEDAYTQQELSVVNDATAMLQYAHFRPAVEDYASVTSLYTDMVESVSTGTSTPEEALETFEAELNRAVGEEAILKK